MRCVFDTNVVVSALLMPASNPRKSLDLARNQGTMLLSFALLAELVDVLNRRRIRKYVDRQDVRRFLAALARECQWVDVNVGVKACRDPNNDKLLSLAVSGSATHLVTGDQDLLALHPFQGIAIVNPRTFVDQQTGR